MDHTQVDQLARAVASGFSRRSVLRQVAASAIAGPLAAAGVAGARADGKDKPGKDKNKGNDRNRGNDDGWDDASGNASAGMDASQGVTPTLPLQTSQTIQTNNQVCAGNCTQTSQQVSTGPVTQTALTTGVSPAGPLPAFRVDIACQFDSARARTNCTCTGRGDNSGPLVKNITLPLSDLCGIVVISEQMRPETRRTIPAPTVPPAPGTSGGGQASAGNGGVANANANGGSVSIGNVSGSNSVSVNASGGNANANASGGNGNVAIAGGAQSGNQPRTQAPDQIVIDPAVLSLVLDGNVGLGRSVIYWVDTDAGRRPAAGPALVPVQEQTAGTGSIVIEVRGCTIPNAQPGYDWFGQCTSFANGAEFQLLPANGAGSPLATASTNPQGRARFANLPPGAYQVKPANAPWCYAESDHADQNGNIQVVADQDSHVWSFVCGAAGGS